MICDGWHDADPIAVTEAVHYALRFGRSPSGVKPIGWRCGRSGGRAHFITHDGAVHAKSAHDDCMDTAKEDLAEWRSRMAHALRAYVRAIEARQPAAKVVKLDQVVHVLEREGRARGFFLDGRSRG